MLNFKENFVFELKSKLANTTYNSERRHSKPNTNVKTSYRLKLLEKLNENKGLTLDMNKINNGSNQPKLNSKINTNLEDSSNWGNNSIENISNNFIKLPVTVFTLSMLVLSLIFLVLLIFIKLLLMLSMLLLPQLLLSSRVGFIFEFSLG